MNDGSGVVHDYVTSDAADQTSQPLDCTVPSAVGTCIRCASDEHAQGIDDASSHRRGSLILFGPFMRLPKHGSALERLLED